LPASFVSNTIFIPPRLAVIGIVDLRHIHRKVREQRTRLESGPALPFRASGIFFRESDQRRIKRKRHRFAASSASRSASGTAAAALGHRLGQGKRSIFDSVK
jgi:hypothetical protein